MENKSTIATQNISKSLEQAWQTVTANIWLFAGFTMLYFIISSVLGLIPVIGSISNLFSFILSASIFAAASLSYKKTELGFNDFFSWTPKFGRLFLGNLVLILLGIAFLIPFVLIIIALLGASFFTGLANEPSELMSMFTITNVVILIVLVFVFAILVSIVLFAYPFIIQFTELSISDALKYSFKIGRNNIGQIVIFAFLSIGLVILGALCLGIGLVVAIPLILLTQYYFLYNIIIPEIEKSEWDFESQNPE